MARHSLLHIVFFILLLSSACCLSGCNEEEIETFEVDSSASTHTCKMTFDVDFTDFDAKDGTTRASIHGWENGDIVYLAFTTSDNKSVGGKAVYGATNNDWTVTYTGTLSSTEQGSVKVYYFDGEVTNSGNTLTIEPTIGVYADLSGTYKYSQENGVRVSACLSPQTSRIRFKGEAGKTVAVGGIKTCVEFACQSGNITGQTEAASVAVLADGYTPYIYGVIADAEKPSIFINNEGCRFTKECSSSMFQIGVSGWMNVPTRAAHENWEMDEIYKAHVVLTDTDNDGVGEMLIFYYDDKDHSKEGMVFDINKADEPEWLDYSEDITNVTFDPSFADAKPTSTNRWFAGCFRLTSIIGIKYLDTSDVVDMSHMFSNSGITNLDLGSFNTSAVTDMSCMFAECTELTSLDLSSFNTSVCTNMRSMFGGCENLTCLDLSNFNTSAVTNMGMMFFGCLDLTELNIGSLNTTAVTKMNDMFGDCPKLTNLDVSSFNTSTVIDMSDMFIGCSGLTSLDISNFIVSEKTNIDNLLYGCSKLTSLNVGNNDFLANNESLPAFDRVGSPSNPCNLIIDSGFDKSVLGDYNGSYYCWRGGYFAEPTKCECVDLGLPSGTLWATFNVGAKRPEEYGDYYRFGEVETRDYYGIENYNLKFPTPPEAAEAGL